MARVNVEQKAFTDARFGRLGLMLVNKEYPEVTIDTAQCLGIGRMTKVWNECQERGSYTLSDHDLVVLLGHRDAARIIIESGLAERDKRNSVRICGTEGRIEWLNKSRENGKLGAEHGKKGGRPKLSPDDTPEKPQEGLSAKPPPAPAPTPTKDSPRDSVDSKTFDEGSTPYRLAVLLLKEIRNNDPAFKSPDLQKWAADFDRLIRIDGRDPQDIARIVRWCQQDAFWRTNILSASKFRKQFTALKLKAGPSPVPMKVLAPQVPSEAERLYEGFMKPGAK